MMESGSYQKPNQILETPLPPTHMVINARLHREERRRDELEVGLDILPQSHGHLGLI